MSRFEIKIVAALLLIAIIPLAASVILVGQVINVSNSYAAGQLHSLLDPMERAADAYRDLFEALKHKFNMQGELLARDASLLASLAEGEHPALARRLEQLVNTEREVGMMSILDDQGQQLAAVRRQKAFDPKRYRSLELLFPLDQTQHQLKIVFFTPRAPFDDFHQLGQAQSSASHLAVLQGKLPRYYRLAFFVIFGAVLVVVTGLGLFISRRTTRRVLVLASATKKVAAGDLDTRVELRTRDELGDLASSFNEMVRQIKESRERIAYLEKIGAWQEIARRLAHEIKNPLTPIQLAIQQIHRKYSGDDPAYQQLIDDAQEIITEEINGLRRLVQDFSAFAKLPSVKPEPVDINQLFDDFFKSHQEVLERAQVTWSRVQPSCQVLVDRLLIKHVLINLMHNAIEAAEEDGTLAELQITLSAQVETLRHRVIVTVTDSGPGIAAEALPRVFEPYFTTKEKGTGLGLAIIKKIILEHQGTIQVVAEAGKGTRFTIALPIT